MRRGRPVRAAANGSRWRHEGRQLYSRAKPSGGVVDASLHSTKRGAPPFCTVLSAFLLFDYGINIHGYCLGFVRDSFILFTIRRIGSTYLFIYRVYVPLFH